MSEPKQDDEAAGGRSDSTEVLGMDDIFADFPPLTPGRIMWGTLFKIIEWEQRHGIGSTSRETLRAYMDDGYGAAQAGLELGLIDYGQASGCEDA